MLCVLRPLRVRAVEAEDQHVAHERMVRRTLDAEHDRPAHQPPRNPGGGFGGGRVAFVEDGGCDDVTAGTAGSSPGGGRSSALPPQPPSNSPLTTMSHNAYTGKRGLRQEVASPPQVSPHRDSRTPPPAATCSASSPSACARHPTRKLSCSGVDACGSREQQRPPRRRWRSSGHETLGRRYPLDICATNGIYWPHVEASGRPR